MSVIAAIRTFLNRGPEPYGMLGLEVKSGDVIEAKVPCRVYIRSNVTWDIKSPEEDDAAGPEGFPYGRIVAHDSGSEIVFVARVEGSEISHVFDRWDKALTYVAFWGFLGENGSPIH